LNILAIVGTYRRGGVVDTAVDAVLEAAENEGAEINKIYLLDKHIEFCANCRTCTQMPGAEPGTCVIDDDMSDLMAAIDRADALILASPMNFWTVTALMKRFIERLVCTAYWPWGAGAPQVRNKRSSKRAVIVASSAAPALMARASTHLVKLLKSVARLLGAKTIGVLFIGCAAKHEKQDIGTRARKKARRLGKKLVAHN